MLLLVRVLSLMCLAAVVSANTETLLIPIPHYYNIPAHPAGYGHGLGSPVHPVRLNETHSLLEDYPIGDKFKQVSVSRSSVRGLYEDSNALKQTLLVKLNNYNDTAFSSDDTLYVKLCWPATEPFDVGLSYQFVHDESVEEMDLYLVIDYKSEAHNYNKNDKLESFSFNLHINNSPYDLVDLIVYLVDLLIIIVSVLLPNIRKFV